MSSTGPTRARTITELPTPSLLVEVDRLERNIDAMAELMRGADVALRPHVKTSKCAEVVRRQLAAGAVGMTCSTPAEVDWLTRLGVANLVWAHLPVGPAKVDFAVRMARDAGLTVIADSMAVAAPLAAAAIGAGVELDYLLEVNTGQGRTGVAPDDAVRLAADIATLGPLHLCGVLTHEGHLSSYGADRPALTAAGGRAGDLLAATAQRLRDCGHYCRIVSVGSTPGATSAPFRPGVTEARPGTYVYYDANQVRLGSAGWEQCALTVLTTVISAHPGRDVIIDAGIKAMSSDTITPENGVGQVCDLASRPITDISFLTANEEHGFLRGQGAAGLRVGDQVRIVPNHACGTTNMWSGLWALRGGRVEAGWAIEARH